MEMKAMKSFVIQQIFLVKNSVNNKLGNNTIPRKVKRKISNRGNLSSKRREQNKKLYNSNAKGKSN